MKQAESKAEAAIDTTAVEVDSVKTDTTEIAKIEIDTINNSFENYETPFLDKAYDCIDDDDSENAFEFAKINIDEILEFNYKEFKKGIKEEGSKVVFFELKNLCFSFIVLFMSIIFVLSFSKKINLIYKLSITNLILLVITVICLFFEGTFEHFHQIKWGYYAFIIINMLIFYYSKSDKIKT
ncbi:hypothetical protein [Flavobacterium sp.]|uniref:hypothetical protein n=1 Tax=Flavobacterium sp. TaxID=239 RepID=UPI002FD9BB3E